MSELPAVPDGHLRVTIGQRDNAVAVLREGASDGRLDFDELDRRVGKALAARTRDDLVRVLADLVPIARMTSTLETVVPVGDGPGYQWENPLLFVGDWRRRTIKRGNWEVPPFMEVSTSYVASVTLDMSHATCRSKVIDLVITSGGGTITLVVPEGWGVDTQHLQTDGMYPTIMTKVPTRPRPDGVRIVVRGRTAGKLSVRNPTPRELRYGS